MPFFKRENNQIYTAENFVKHKDYELTKENKNQHTYPVDGWYWFENLDDAMRKFLE